MKWPMVRLGDVCELQNGYTPKPHELAETGSIPYYRVGAMNFPGNEVTLVQANAFLKITPRRVFPKGAIVFPKNGGAVLTRKVRRLSRGSVVDLNTGVCFPKDGNIDEAYLSAWFCSFDILTCTVVGTLPFVDFGMLKDARFPLPPLPEQKRIVAELEKKMAAADRLVASFAAMADQARALFRSTLSETFARIKADKVRLGDLGSFFGGHTPSTKEPKFWNGTIPWVSSQEVKVDELFDTERKLTKAGAAELELFDAGTLLMVMRSGVLAHTFPVAVARTTCTVNQDIKAMKVGKKATPKYLFWFLRGAERVILKNYMSKGATVQSIKFECLLEMPVTVPPLPEQRRIVAELDAAKARCEAVEAKAREGLAQAELLRKAVLKEAFE